MLAESSRKGEGFAPPYTMALSASGHHFANLVLTNYQAGTLTSADVAEYLGVRLKHLEKIQQALTGPQR